MLGVRKFLFSFLVVLMITPSLACAMPTCADRTGSMTQVEQPCADHHSNNQDSKKDTNQVNLLLDCMSVDLQKADSISVDKPDLEIDQVSYALYSETLASLTILSNIDTIRGPPNRASLPLKALPIFMTTQRFRI